MVVSAQGIERTSEMAAGAFSIGGIRPRGAGMDPVSYEFGNRLALFIQDANSVHLDKTAILVHPSKTGRDGGVE